MARKKAGVSDVDAPPSSDAPPAPTKKMRAAKKAAPPDDVGERVAAKKAPTKAAKKSTSRKKSGPALPALPGYEELEDWSTPQPVIRDRVLNATPIHLTLWSDDNPVLQLQAFERATLPDFSPTAVLELRPTNWMTAIPANGRIQRGSGDDELVITPGDLRTAPFDVALITVVLTNDTDGYVDVFTVEPNGSETSLAAGMAPGVAWDGGVRAAAEVLAIRSTFTGALVGMVVVGAGQFGSVLPTRRQTISVNSECRERLDKVLPLPAPLPEAGVVEVIGGARERPDPGSRDYVVTSQHENLVRQRFNTRPNVVTRSVRIAGADLLWRAGNESGVMSYQGTDVLDVEELEIFADRVVINEPLRFPGTNVTIYARRLEFGRRGSIDTTPIARSGLPQPKVVAEDPTRVRKEGDPEPTYETASGLDGERGGDISIFVEQVVVAEGDAGPRFIARGANGQAAEPGGLERYKASSPKSPPAITQSGIEGTFREAFVLAKDWNAWRWPGEVWSPNDVTYQGLRLLESGRVVDLTIVAHDDEWQSQDTNIFFFSSKVEKKNFAAVWDNIPVDSMEYFGSRIGRPATVRPGDGEVAYSGGKPGDGGAGGRIVTSLPLEVITPLCDTSGGAAGPETAAVAGGAAGTPQNQPNPAFVVEMHIVKSTFFQSSRSPTLRVTETTASPGSGKPAVYGRDGDSTTPTAEARSWVRPEIVDAVLACARDAFRNGHRDVAQRLLDPYYARIQSHDDGEDEELLSRAVTITAMRGNLRSNLDYYGNPPGWLPRLRLSANFDAFVALRLLAMRMLYYGQKGEQKYSSLAERRAISQQASEILDNELTIRVTELKGRINELATARLALEKVREKAQSKQAELDLLKRLTEAEALPAIERQRIFRGATKVVAGLMKVSPVGQPYLGLAGDVTSTLGEMNFTDPDAIPKQIGDALGKIGGTTDTFLKTNGDLIESRQVSALRSEMRLNLEKTDDLTEQVAQVKSTTGGLERTIASRSAKIEAKWDTEREAELAWYKEELAAVQTKLDPAAVPAAVPATEDAKKVAAQQEERKQWLTEQIEATENATLSQYRAALANEIASRTEVVARDKSDAKLEAAGLEAERVRVLTADRQRLEASKSRMDEVDQELRASKRLDKDLTAQETLRKAATQDTLKRLRTMGSGITMLGTAIATLGTPATTADADVQAYTQMLLKSKRRAEYDRITREFGDVAKEQSDAMGKLMATQQRITAGIAEIAENLSAQNGLSRQRQSLDGVLDVRAQRYLRGMQARARDLMRWSMYNLVMSYRYEYLFDVENEFFNYDTIVDELRKLETAKLADGKTVSLAALTADEVKAVDDAVMQDVFLGEARKILEERQHRVGAAMQNIHILRLSPAQLRQLRVRGQVTFNLVRDLNAGTFDTVDYRIVDIDLNSITIDTENPALSVRLVFRHSGESVILGRDRTGKPHYYYFRAAPGDDPIEWGFSYNHAADGTTVKRIKKDVKDIEPDAMLRKLLDPANTVIGGVKVEFKEYSPGFFSDITLYLTGGAKGKAADIKEISALQFTVTYSHKTELHR